MRLRHIEQFVWAVLAFGGGLAAGWVDRSASEVQAPLLVLMVASFAVNLPGRASPWLTAVLTVAGMMLVSMTAWSAPNVGMLIALIPAGIAAFGGKFFGSLLDTAASRLVPSEAETEPLTPWYRRPLPTRFLLAITLMTIAGVSGSVVLAPLRAIGNPAANWLGGVWQILTLLGWIAIAPVFLRRGRSNAVAATGVTLADMGRHALIVLALAVAHAASITAICGFLLIPLVPDWLGLAQQAFFIYLPLDFLAYLTILALGYASDVERLHRDAEQREAALKAESLESRLSALRARLNPHFLFNALNSVGVLARAGRSDDTARVVDGINGLLRYVLDERNASVPLADELQFARDYLSVQQVRFGDRLTFTIESGGELAAARVPQLVLQPIVENAVEHGVANALAGGRVSVTATRDADTLVLTVDDDGPGVAGASGEKGIGLANTRERLARLFGAKAALTIAPRGQGGGTRVMIRLPFATT